MFAFFLVMVLIPSSAADGPKLVGYVSDLRQSAGLVTSTYRYATVTAEFAEDMFLALQCNQGTTSIPVQLDSCTDCLSFESVAQLDLKTQTETQTRFVIANFNTCNEGVVVYPLLHQSKLELMLNWGVASVAFKDDGYSPLPIHMCCEELRERGGADWDGTLFVTATSQVDQPFELSLHGTEERLPLDMFYPLVPFTLTCDNSHSCNETIGCRQFNIESTSSDPFYNWGWQKLNGELNNNNNNTGFFYPPLSKREGEATRSLTSTILISVLRPGETLHDYTVGVGPILTEDLLLDSDCRISYSGLVTKDGTPLDTSGLSINPILQVCDVRNFDYFQEGFDQAIEALNNGTMKTLTGSVSLINLGYLFTSSLDWTACKLNLQKNLEPKTEEYEIFTKSCLIPFDRPEERALDPCCNKDPTLCCLGGTYSVNFTKFNYLLDFTSGGETSEVEMEGESGACLYPDCVTESLAAYATYTDQQSLCADEYQSAVNDKNFNFDPWEYCTFLVFPYHKRACIHDSTCQKYFGAPAYCNMSTSSCVASCSEDSECYIGDCVGGYCLKKETPKPTILENFALCLLEHLDSDLSSLMRDKLSKNGIGSAKHEELLLEEISDFSCNYDYPEFGMPFEVKARDQETCEAGAYCPHLECIIGSTEWCTEENCTPQYEACNYRNLAGANGLSLVSAIESHCEYRMEDTAAQTSLYAQICAEAGGTIPSRYLYLRRSEYGICDTGVKAQSSSDCWTEGCIPNLNNLPCSSYCYFDGQDSSSCPLLGATYKWYSWEFNGMTNTGCVKEDATTYASCIGAGGNYFLGRKYMPQQMTPSQCNEGWCRYTRGSSNTLLNPVHLSKDECLLYPSACSTCMVGSTNPECFAVGLPPTTPTLPVEDLISLCTQSGSCTQSFPLPCLVTNDHLVAQLATCPWTPNGCVFSFGGQCISLGGTPFATNTKENCEGFAQICKEDPTMDPYGHFTRTQYDIPDGLSFKSQAECEKCGHSYQSFYGWDQARWILQVREWHVYSYWGVPKIVKPIWEPFVSVEKWETLLEEVKAVRLGGIATSELYCRFAIEKQFIFLHSCNCAVREYDSDIDSRCTEELSSIYGNTVTTTNICSGREREIRDSRNITVLVGKQFKAGDQLCSPLTLTTTNFEVINRPLTSISSLSVISETKRTLNNQRGFVYNTEERVVVVGQIIGDGYGIKVAENVDDVSDLIVCLPLPDPRLATENWDLSNAEIFYVALAEYSPERGSCVPTPYIFELHEVNSSVCLPVTKSVLLFPVGLVEDFATASMSDTWSSPELGLFIFCDVMYFILLCITVYSLVSRIWTLRSTDKDLPLWNTSTIGLPILILLVTLRFVYFMTVPFGYYDDYFGLVAVFSDLPTLLYYFVLVYISATWYDVYKRSKTLDNSNHQMRMLVQSSLVVGSLLIFWIAFYVAFGVIEEESQPPSCVIGEDDSLTTSQKVSLTYKVIFSFYSVCLAIMFAAIAMLFFSLRLSKKKQKIAYWLETITVITTLALLAQAAIAIASIFVNMSNVLKVSLIIAFELFPLYGISLLFEDHHGLSHLASQVTKKSSTSKKSTTKSLKTSTSLSK